VLLLSEKKELKFSANRKLLQQVSNVLFSDEIST
jgi:hypothetical protein